MDHLQSKDAGPDLPHRAQTVAFLYLLDLAGIKVQPAQGQLAGLICQGDRQLFAGTIGDIRTQDLPLHLERLARLQTCDRRNPRLILISDRQVQHQILGIMQSKLGEFLHNEAGSALGGGNHQMTSTASTSNCAPLGRLDTPTVDLAGNGWGMMFAMMLLTNPNCERSVKKRVSLTI